LKDLRRNGRRIMPVELSEAEIRRLHQIIVMHNREYIPHEGDTDLEKKFRELDHNRDASVCISELGEY
jgi:hypothetical protein